MLAQMKTAPRPPRDAAGPGSGVTVRTTPETPAQALMTTRPPPIRDRVGALKLSGHQGSAPAESEEQDGCANSNVLLRQLAAQHGSEGGSQRVGHDHPERGANPGTEPAFGRV
jgi:hypothetical protein